ncbi:LysR family transcriptional regulator [Brevibacillus sp. GCM10020057]|uniref:LysR family transcriptional regulator n=1 Tax=Brevibacillus sp. GCM10020057 TaxID=3317327 RepID=UPI0036421D42
MTLLQIHVFIAISKTGSFTKAGEMLNLTQSAISQTLAGLEAEVGLVLFHRGKNGVTLTDAGERLIPYAHQIVNSEEQFKQVASSINGLQTGHLRIGCFPSFMASHMPELISGFRKCYPKISIEFKEGNYEEIITWLLGGAVDVAFNVKTVDPLQFIPLMNDPLLVVMPKDHRYANQTELTVEQIKSEPFIRDTGCEHFLEKLFPDSGQQPNYQFGVRDTFALLAMVQSGLGITVLPKMSVPENLLSVCTSEFYPKVVRTIGLCYNSRRTISPGASAFVRYVTDTVKQSLL